MRRRTWVICGCVALWLLCGSAPHHSMAAGKKKPKAKAAGQKRPGKNAGKKPGKNAAKKPGKAKPKAGDWEPGFAAMDRRLDLKANQRTKLKKLWAERNKALSNWDLSQPGQQLVVLQGELALAAPAERSGMESRMAPLLAQRQLLDREHLTRIMAVLNKEQRTRWNALLLRREVDKVLFSKKISLTSEQEQKVRSLCERAAKALPDVPSAADMARARDRISRAMLREILTAAQRKKVDPDARATASKGKGKKGDGKDKGKGKGKKKSNGRKGGKGGSNRHARGGGKKNKRGKGKDKGGSMSTADRSIAGKTPGGKAGYVQFAKPKKKSGGKKKSKKN